jgi:aromatic-L-amino-acid decarboxylase
VSAVKRGSSRLPLSSAEFESLARQIAGLCAGYLEDLDSRPIAPVSSGAALDKLFAQPWPEQPQAAESLRALREVVANVRAQNARFFGYVLGSGDPVGALADLLASVLNQNVTAWRSGPAAVTLEKLVVGWLAEAIGCSGMTGSLCGGGSAANLMGLAMAREAAAPANETGAPRGAVYMSAEAHMSIGKSVALLGIGRKNLRLIATGADYRMRIDDLERMLAADRAAGLPPIAIVATAGTVNTGAIDPLPEIAALARVRKIWLHVDGAYGALAALAASEKFRGLELADSVSLDPHKWLYQPLDCGCLLFRDAAAARRAFCHTGAYAQSLSSDPLEGFQFFDESLELSRRFRALKLWLAMRYHGKTAFRESIATDLALAQRLATAIRDSSDMELLAPVSLSAICFRVLNVETRPAASPDEKLNTLNRAVLAAVNRRGRVYLSNAELGGRFALRACIVNHRTTEADVDAVLEEVRAAAESMRR